MKKVDFVFTAIICIIIFVAGFIGGFVYSSTKNIPTPTTVTKSKTITQTYTTTHHIYTYATTTSIITVEKTHVNTIYSEITSTVTETTTIKLINMTTKFTTTTISPEIKLSYPHKSSTSLDLNSDGILDLFVEINPWNIRSYKGTQYMTIDLAKRFIKTEVNLTDVEPVEWVNGYPELYIGRKPWGNRYANGFGIKFPMKISDLSPFTISFYICIENIDETMNFNIAADAWIVNEDAARKLGTPPGNGDVEIMVWLYNQNLNPAGKKIGEEVVPMIINSTKINVVFEVWRDDSVAWGGWQYVAFKPKDWNIKCGHVAYDPTLFVKILTKYTTFNISNHYLLGWEIGTEWGTRSSNGIARFTWVMKDFVAIPGVTISE